MRGSEGFRAVARHVLKTGTELQLGFGSPPKDRVRAAVVYTDASGRMSELERHVAEEVGFAADLAERLDAPAQLFEDAALPVLVVKVDASKGSPRALGEALDAGLQVLLETKTIDSIWLPVFDPDRARWAPEQTVETCVDSLIRLGSFLGTVLLAASNEATARSLRAVFESGQLPLRDSAEEPPPQRVYEPHVTAALDLAAGIASDNAIEGWHVLHSVLYGPLPADMAVQTKARR